MENFDVVPCGGIQPANPSGLQISTNILFRSPILDASISFGRFWQPQKCWRRQKYVMMSRIVTTGATERCTLCKNFTLPLARPMRPAGLSISSGSAASSWSSSSGANVLLLHMAVVNFAFCRGLEDCSLKHKGHVEDELLVQTERRPPLPMDLAKSNTHGHRGAAISETAKLHRSRAH